METGISIHAPREGSDTATDELLSLLIISIHAPREGSDRPGFFLFAAFLHFYPRSPRGERPTGKRRLSSAMRYFYPRSPRGERRAKALSKAINGAISIHAPREGSDHFRAVDKTVKWISIHAPREGSDRRPGRPTLQYTRFLSTLPARGATGDKRVYFQKRPISIHAPREGSDTDATACKVTEVLFLSTLPARGATGPATGDRGPA